MAAGSSLLIWLTPETPYGQVLLALLLLGAGDIAVITPIADVILSAVPRERTGSAAALINPCEMKPNPTIPEEVWQRSFRCLPRRCPNGRPARSSA